MESITCIRMELGEPDASGRRSPVPIQGSEFTHGGGRGHHGPGHQSQPHELRRNSRPGDAPGRAAWPRTRRDTPPWRGVFAGGDAATGAATVILAMGAGKHAAKAIDEYLKSKK